MPPKFEIPGVDGTHPHFDRIVEFFSERFEEKNKVIDAQAKRLDAQAKRLDAQAETINSQAETINSQAETINSQAERLDAQAEEIEQLKEEIEELRSARFTSRQAKRGYNARKYDYSRPKTEKRKYSTSYNVTHPHEQRTADIQYCPACGATLSESANSYKRNVEDPKNGQWCITEWVVMRRFCKSCNKQYSADIPGVLKNEHFGTTIMAQIFVLRQLVPSYEKLQKILHMLYGRYIHKSTLIDMCHRVADQCEPLYNEILEDLLKCHVIHGDETGWYLDANRYWAWVFTSPHSVLYHMSPYRKQMVAEAILKDFEGIVSSDSYSAWNKVGGSHQRCLIHYKRNLYRTKDKNKTEEFITFWNEIHDILKTATDAWEKSDVPLPHLADTLESRIEALTSKSYKDKDCNRYVKLLNREGKQLFTFLRHTDVEYHNNRSERDLRWIALMRKITYGSRSERGVRTMEINASVYATCEARGISPCDFVKDYLDGNLKSIPMPKESMLPIVATPQKTLLPVPV